MAAWIGQAVRMQESSESSGGVGATALGAAEMRAEESVRPDRLFDDPYAAAFVGAAPPLFPELDSISDDPEIAALKAAFSADAPRSLVGTCDGCRDRRRPGSGGELGSSARMHRSCRDRARMGHESVGGGGGN
jgi:hypothetical protein